MDLRALNGPVYVGLELRSFLTRTKYGSVSQNVVKSSIGLIDLISDEIVIFAMELITDFMDGSW
jgi:hypothetical protein